MHGRNCRLCKLAAPILLAGGASRMTLLLLLLPSFASVNAHI